MWQVLVVDYLSSVESGVLHDAYQSGQLIITDNAADMVYKKFEHIKSLFKKHYFDDRSLHTLDRHKRAALLTYAFISVKPLLFPYVSKDSSVFLLFPNEAVAFYFGLHFLTIDYPESVIDRINKEFGGTFFNLPNTYYSITHGICSPSDEYGYIANVCRDLHFTQVFRNYDILAMADRYFLLEKGFSNLQESDLYLDCRQSAPDESTDGGI